MSQNHPDRDEQNNSTAANSQHVEMVAPDTVVVSEHNERQSFDPTDLDESDPGDDELSEAEQFQQLIDSVRESGIVEPPVVIPRTQEHLHLEQGQEQGQTDAETGSDVDAEYEVIVGQRRTYAAKQAGLDEIPVIVTEDISTTDALKASITENIASMQSDVSPGDRGQAIQRLWEEMGNTGVPTFSEIGEELGVPQGTVRTWCEPLRDEWKDTKINPGNPESEIFYEAGSIGERALQTIRVMTEDYDTETRERVAELAQEYDATRDQVNRAKNLVEAQNIDPGRALKAVLIEDDATPTESESNSEESQANDDQSSPVAAESQSQNPSEQENTSTEDKDNDNDGADTGTEGFDPETFTDAVDSTDDTDNPQDNTTESTQNHVEGEDTMTRESLTLTLELPAETVRDLEAHAAVDHDGDIDAFLNEFIPAHLDVLAPSDSSTDPDTDRNRDSPDSRDRDDTSDDESEVEVERGALSERL